MTSQYVMQRDTAGWRTQVWISFGLAFCASAIGVLLLPGQELDRAFLAIGLFFCLFSSFSVAKMVRDNRDGQVDTPSWITTVWIAFGAAFCLTAWGLWRMEIGDWQKGFMLVSWLFLVSTTFTVAKTVRDQHEADLMDRAANETLEVTPEVR
ncbi:YiaA/YiaB family inner membrane protein [Limnohabitans sp.]|jgi:hypothetical protein|uniref:YiaA/YiaB family inner membrane protein n=1 Tax=Limnohabitans sp. TaxID=1907725 RepID=UPI0037C0CEC8